MSNIVAMTKNGATLGVHSTCVEDHERNGWVVGGELRDLDDTAGVNEGDLSALRADYLAKLGKKPFPGWDADELRRRMVEAGV